MRLVAALTAALAAVLAPAACSSQVKPRAEVLTGAFEPGIVGEAEGERFPIRVVSLGELNLASGKLHVLDPFVGPWDGEPLALNIPPGRYPVDLAVADTGGGGVRTALARIRLSTSPP